MPKVILFVTAILLGFSSPCLPAENVPVILVKGYGPRFAQMLRYQKFLARDGVRNVHVLQYDQSAAPADLQRGAQAALDAIIRRYPSQTRFDMITHSFGGFVGLYTAMPSIHAGRIRKYISLASVAHGQNWLPFCARGWCGQTLPKLIPYRNPFIQDFFTRYRAPVARLEKCSLYSYSDNVVHEPADSGKFDDGVNVEVRGARHMDFVTDERLYRLMRSVCYGAPAPRGGHAFDWRVK